MSPPLALPPPENAKVENLRGLSGGQTKAELEILAVVVPNVMIDGDGWCKGRCIFSLENLTDGVKELKPAAIDIEDVKLAKTALLCCFSLYTLSLKSHRRSFLLPLPLSL